MLPLGKITLIFTTAIFWQTYTYNGGGCFCWANMGTNAIFWATRGGNAFWQQSQMPSFLATMGGGNAFLAKMGGNAFWQKWGGQRLLAKLGKATPLLDKMSNSQLLHCYVGQLANKIHRLPKSTSILDVGNIAKRHGVPKSQFNIGYLSSDVCCASAVTLICLTFSV